MDHGLDALELRLVGDRTTGRAFRKRIADQQLGRGLFGREPAIEIMSTCGANGAQTFAERASSIKAAHNRNHHFSAAVRTG